eukprot:PhM_4_TR13053/c0_g1_i1/m.106019
MSTLQGMIFAGVQAVGALRGESRGIRFTDLVRYIKSNFTLPSNIDRVGGAEKWVLGELQSLIKKGHLVNLNADVPQAHPAVKFSEETRKGIESGEIGMANTKAVAAVTGAAGKADRRAKQKEMRVKARHSAIAAKRKN